MTSKQQTANSKQLQTLKVKRLHPTVKLPSRSHGNDAGIDLFLADDLTLAAGERQRIALGISIELPVGTVGLIWDRGSKARDGLKSMGGVIDEGYRGELQILLVNLSQETLSYPAGTSIVQLLVQPVFQPQIAEIDNLTETERGEKGFGSSDSQ